jgi:hypothetical protein
MKPLQPALITLYADLLQQVTASTVPAGSVRTQIVKGREYLKANTTIGAERSTIYIGNAADPDAKIRAQAMREEMERARSRRQTIGLLHRAGFPRPAPELGRVLESLASANLFRKGMVLVGTAAYQCYSPMVGVILPAASMMTQDLDLATASLALSADFEERHIAAPSDDQASGSVQSFEQVLRRADSTFQSLPGLNPKTLPSHFRARSGFLVDVLVPQRSRKDTNPVPIPGLQAGGTPLQHLAWLINDPSPAIALYGSGVFVRVPQPARYAVHKLILAQKRHSDAIKRQKDLAQARSLIEALRGSEPHAFEDAMDDARSQGAKGWSEPIDRSLREMGLFGPIDQKAAQRSTMRSGRGKIR